MKKHFTDDEHWRAVEPVTTGSRSSFRLGLIVGLVIGIFSGWAVFRRPTDFARLELQGVTERPDSAVTRETFIKITPGASFWEVHDLLGSGEVISERGLVVDEHGRYRKWDQDANRRTDSSGTLPDHDGQAFEEVRQTVRWSNGWRVITVVFLNDTVETKHEENLY